MKNDAPKEDALIRNLRDAGCTQAFIAQFLEIHSDTDAVNQKRLLMAQRNLLLENLRRAQNRLDCLNYLLFQLKKH